ncbi:hypothetical protein M5O73_004091 [Escherichia coli]|nr:hypothetical protein [Escherichia coli]
MQKLYILLPFLLCSCAMPKTQMDDRQYNFLAGMAGGIDTCLNNDLMDYRIAGTGKSLVSSYLSVWEYDQEKYKQRYQQAIKTFTKKPVTRAECNQLSADIYRQNQALASFSQQKQQENQNRQLQSLNDAVRAPIHTNCTNYGGSVSCTSY